MNDLTNAESSVYLLQTELSALVKDMSQNHNFKNMKWFTKFFSCRLNTFQNIINFKLSIETYRTQNINKIMILEVFEWKSIRTKWTDYLFVERRLTICIIISNFALLKCILNMKKLKLMRAEIFIVTAK